MGLNQAEVDHEQQLSEAVFRASSKILLMRPYTNTVNMASPRQLVVNQHSEEFNEANFFCRTACVQSGAASECRVARF